MHRLPPEKGPGKALRRQHPYLFRLKNRAKVPVSELRSRRKPDRGNCADSIDWIPREDITPLFDPGNEKGGPNGHPRKNLVAVDLNHRSRFAGLWVLCHQDKPRSHFDDRGDPLGSPHLPQNFWLNHRSALRDYEPVIRTKTILVLTIKAALRAASSNTQNFWLRGVDLNHRPLGYERPKISVSIGQQGTSGNPETPLGTAGTAYWGPNGDLFGICPTMYPTICPNLPNGAFLQAVECTNRQ